MNIEELEALLKPKEEIVYITQLRYGDKFKFIHGCALDKGVWRNEIDFCVYENNSKYTAYFTVYYTNGEEEHSSWSIPCCEDKKYSCCNVLKL